MKVYGGEWDLPEAPTVESPFKAYLIPQQSPVKTVAVAVPLTADEPHLVMPEEMAPTT